MSNIKLTDEQRKLVEDNYKLVHHMNNKYGVFKYVDDAEGLLALGLCKAARAFEPDKGAFSTYACHVMLKETQYEFRKNRHRIHPITDDLFISGDKREKTDMVSIFEFLPDPEDRNSEFDLISVSEKVLSTFRPKAAKIIRMHIYEDVPASVVTKKLGYSSTTYVYKTIDRYRKKMEEYRNDIFN